MERYKIYCTEEQIKKALELGAPIKFEQKFYIDWKDGKRVPYPDVERDKDGNPIFIPVTAEQMIGWLEEQKNIKEISVYCDVTGLNWSFEGYKDNGGYAFAGRYSYSSRKEATIAAIDAALEYLSSHKTPET